MKLFCKSNVAAQKKWRAVVVLEIHRKLTCDRFFLFCRLQDSNLLEKFKKSNLAKVSFLKLLTRKNLLQ